MKTLIAAPSYVQASQYARQNRIPREDLRFVARLDHLRGWPVGTTLVWLNEGPGDIHLRNDIAEAEAAGRITISYVRY